MDSIPLYDETSLLKSLADGDVKAFAKIYDHFQPRLYLFIYPLTQFSRQDTEEVIQDIFLKVWLRKETLTTVKSLQAYLFTMAKNRLHDIRSRPATVGLTLNADDPHSPVEETILLNEYHAIARQAIDRLPLQKRRIFLLRNETGLSLDEIATHLNITKSAVKKQLYDALRIVKTYLKDHAGIDIPILVLLTIYQF